MDRIDRMCSLPRERKSSEYLYGVPACHFANMTYKGAIKEKIRLAKFIITELNILIKNELLPAKPEENEEYSELQKAEMRINSIEKEIEFNEFILLEIKKCKQ